MLNCPESAHSQGNKRPFKIKIIRKRHYVTHESHTTSNQPKGVCWSSQDEPFSRKRRPTSTANFPKENHLIFENTDPLMEDSNTSLESRKQLIKKLATIHHYSSSSKSSFYLGINIFDRYRRRKYLPLDTYDLAGLVSLVIAMKYEETIRPNYNTFASLGFKVKEMVEMEYDILQLLKFQLTIPTIYTSLQNIMSIHCVPPNVQLISEQLLGKLIMQSDVMDECYISIAEILILIAFSANHSGKTSLQTLFDHFKNRNRLHFPSFMRLIDLLNVSERT
mmetsp:Transcript_4636/g.6379  ORF Transcript_4636/g.6379 Transcript_4636/m.6379 type:complete len:278 (+) Transcript_4636:162-995(+)